MHYNVEFLPIADKDIEEIDEHLSRFDSSTASNFFQSLHKRLILLEDNPRIYSTWEDNPAYQHFIIGNYLVFYLVSDEDRLVTIVRIVDGRRKLTRSNIEI